MKFLNKILFLNIFCSLNILPAEVKINLHDKLAKLGSKITQVTPYLRIEELTEIQSQLRRIDATIDKWIEGKINRRDEAEREYKSLIQEKSSLEFLISNLELSARQRCCTIDKYACSLVSTGPRSRLSAVDRKLSQYYGMNMKNLSTKLAELRSLKRRLNQVKFNT
jgi:hypothetical protein